MSTCKVLQYEQKGIRLFRSTRQVCFIITPSMVNVLHTGLGWEGANSLHKESGSSPELDALIHKSNFIIRCKTWADIQVISLNIFAQNGTCGIAQNLAAQMKKKLKQDCT